jgi:two-component system, LuxR family, response regulator FixJ
MNYQGNQEVQPRVMVVDDDALSRRFAEHWLRGSQMATTSYPSGRAALEAFDSDKPECIVLDLEMDGMGGLDVLEELTRAGKYTQIVLFTATAEVASAVRAMKLGAVDVLLKPVEPPTFVKTVQQAVHQGRTVGRVNAKIESARKRLKDLSPRERDVAKLLGEGHSNKQVAYSLNVSPRTVEIHRARIMAKSGADSFAELVRLIDLCAA